jgi:hypothetical protein
MDITEEHPIYSRNKKVWTQIYTELEGQEAIKSKGEKYLPFPVSIPTDIKDSDEFKQQYAIYLAGANFVNFTGQAVEDSVASIFSRDPIIAESFPPELDYLELGDTAREVATSIVSYGSALLVINYPKVEQGITLEQEKAEGVAAYYTVYEPLNVLNWTTKVVAGVSIYTRIVLRELIVNDESEEVWQYTELILQDGAYLINTYDENGDFIESVQPVATGKRLTSIPALFTGVLSNSNIGKDKSPILGIANTNLKHYENTAELQSVISYISHPMLTISGAPMGFIDEMKATGSRITVGASNSLVIEGETGKAELLQISPDLVHFNQLEQLEKSMAEQGARLKASEKGGVESAKALAIRNSGSTSKLASIATQIEKTIRASMEYVNAFMGTSVPDDFEFSLVKDYINLEPDPTLITTLNNLANGGRIPDYVLFDYLVDTKLLSDDADYNKLRTDSEALDLGLTFDGGGDAGI